MIEIKNENRPNLKEMFDKYMKKLSEREAKIKELYPIETLVNLFASDDFDYEAYEDDVYDGYIKPKNSWNKTKDFLKKLNTKQKTKKSKKTRHGAKKKNKQKDYFTDDDMLYDAIAEDKVVNYYPDINNPDYLETFYNLHDFDEYITSQGIDVSEEEVRNIMNRDITHCTVQNINGKAQLVSDSSYGGLYWTCNPENVYSMYN